MAKKPKPTPSKPSKAVSPKSAKVVREQAATGYAVRQAHGAATAAGRVVGAAEFKANCLALMDEVNASGAEFVITKHGRPVARLVPVVGHTYEPFIGRSPGMIFGTPEEVLAPMDIDWDEDANLFPE